MVKGRHKYYTGNDISWILKTIFYSISFRTARYRPTYLYVWPCRITAAVSVKSIRIYVYITTSVYLYFTEYDRYLVLLILQICVCVFQKEKNYRIGPAISKRGQGIVILPTAELLQIARLQPPRNEGANTRRRKNAFSRRSREEKIRRIRGRSGG